MAVDGAAGSALLLAESEHAAGDILSVAWSPNGSRIVLRGDLEVADRNELYSVPGNGSAEKVKITPEERATAIRAAKAMGLNLAGVDLLRSNHGPVVMEVNSSPGLEGIEQSSKKDVAGMIIEFIERTAGKASKSGDK